MIRQVGRALTLAVFFVSHAAMLRAGTPEPVEALAKLGAEFVGEQRAVIQSRCLECHSTDERQGELDLERFQTLKDLRAGAATWQKVREMLASGEMPPADAEPLTGDERHRLESWVARFLHAEALVSAGDPGPVVLRRLNNAEYTYTIRDLTGVATLDPAREFPVDGAAGEGFTNVGSAMAMSPAMAAKYFDAAKRIAEHAVLLPEGFRFSPSTTRRDWTNEVLASIRELYARHSGDGQGTEVNLQGIVFNTNDGGLLPIARYLDAALQARDGVRAETTTIEAVARERGLSAKYLAKLWSALEAPPHSSQVMDSIREAWRRAVPGDAAALAAGIGQWQNALWKFNSVGHIGKVGGPKSWQEAIAPLAGEQVVRETLSPPEGGQNAEIGRDKLLYLAISDAGDGNEQDFAVLRQPRLVAKGRPDLMLSDVRRFCRHMLTARKKIFSCTSRALAAAAEAIGAKVPPATAELAAQHQLEPEALAAWLGLLGVGADALSGIELLPNRQTSNAGYEFVQGWSLGELPSLVANSSDQAVRIPGNMKARGVCVHPTPDRRVAVGWRSPIEGKLSVRATVTHAHPECGNGVEWSVEVRRGSTRQVLDAGAAQGPQPASVGPFGDVVVHRGDLVVLAIGPREGNHSCDLTDLEFSLEAEGPERAQSWSLTRDVSADVLQGNPHADSLGNAGVWHFFSEPVSGAQGAPIPSGTLLAAWLAAGPDEQKSLAERIERLLVAGPQGNLAADHPDVVLYREMTSLGGPLLASAWKEFSAAEGPNAAERGTVASDRGAAEERDSETGEFGLAPEMFGHDPRGEAIAPSDLCVQAPAVLEVRLPADLTIQTELVATLELRPDCEQGSVQFRLLDAPPADNGLVGSVVSAAANAGPWTSSGRQISHKTPVIVRPAGAAEARFHAAFNEFRELFPLALCYTKIVPVDEVVTLTLFYREDDALSRLMLNEAEAARLNQLWSELHFISQDALTLVDAYKQLMEFATQDADPKVFEPLGEPIRARAAAFAEALRAAEAPQIDALVRFVAQAFRRPIEPSEEEKIRVLCAQLRSEELTHEDAFRLTLARVLVSPAFLYRLDHPAAGDAPARVSPWELATRLSYFLWSTAPDDALRQRASSGELVQTDVLLAEARRMLGDDRIRNLAIEFGGQWLHTYGFEQLNEKSERHFPTFAALRGAMAEETTQFLAHLFRGNAPVSDLIDADYTFLNEALAAHYEIPGVAGEAWRRVEGVRAYGRGGVLGLASTLAKQSGASRTSPILRGNWLYEVILGQRLPRPPKNVPVLPDDVPQGLTERQLIERHSSDAACAKCHVKIDPFGFALESYDAIGRLRKHDAAGLPIDTRTTLEDGSPVDGIDGLRQYLRTTRQNDFLRQFAKKLLGYALGRGAQLSDVPLLERILSRWHAEGGQVWIAIEEIVASDQFRNVRPDLDPAVASASPVSDSSGD